MAEGGPGLGGFGGHGVGDEIALGEIAAEGVEVVEGFEVLDTFGGDQQAEAVAELDDGLDDGAGLLGLAGVEDEGFVDFDLREGHADELDEGGEAGAEVVDGELETLDAETGEQVEREDGIDHGSGLGDLEDNALGGSWKLWQTAESLSARWRSTRLLAERLSESITPD